jgi:hypothetical protein
MKWVVDRRLGQDQRGGYGGREGQPAAEIGEEAVRADVVGVGVGRLVDGARRQHSAQPAEQT